MEEFSLSNVVLELVSLFLLIGVNAYFAVMEISVVGSRRSRIDQMAAEGSSGARIVQDWLKDDNSQSRFIASAQLGVTFASLALGVVGEGAVDDIIQAVFGRLQINGTLAPLLDVLPFLLSLIIVSSLHLVFGEQVPKVSALLAPEKTAVLLAWPMRAFSMIFSPMISLLNAATGSILRAIGLRSVGEQTTVYTVEEIRQILRESEASGVLEEQERELIDSVFDIRNLLVVQVMVPRTEIKMFGADTSLDEVVKVVLDTPFTKYPVYDRDPDDIIGILYIRDVVKALTHSRENDMSARNLVSKALFVPESLSLSRLLELFREKGEHIAIVYDEYGGTDGLVTLDDVMSRLTGELPGHYEDEIARIAEVIRYGDDYLVSGLMSLETFNEAFDMELADPNYNTIGGYIMGRLDRVPEVGDVVRVNGMSVCVETMADLRIDRLRVECTA